MKEKCKYYGVVAVQMIPVAVAAWICMRLARLPELSDSGIGPLTVAIIAGIAAGNIIPPQYVMKLFEGVQFGKTKLLRLGIVLYGFRITLSQLAYAGWPALLTDVFVVGSTFWLAMVIGRRFKLDSHTAALVGAGSAICGAAAVLAAQPVLKAKEHAVSVAVATVVVFGTVAMFLYPLLAGLLFSGGIPDAGQFAWGVFTGGTIHEVAQVAAAGSAVNQTVADVAVITKMIRVILLAPFLLLLPWIMRYFDSTPAEEGGIVIPWFAFGFLAVAGVNSFLKLPPKIHDTILNLDMFLLTAAMFALGLTTRWQSIRQAGVKPLLTAGILMLWLMAGGGLISYAACCLLG
ncbi:YeiH family putative sulfate export transporter [Neisseria weixii]|uniref:YeiH family putative sulfate export transporter n=1 Tax=Neisseria weixii TaxID=1853276 RepID=A0A3N4N143_9NEIS|nr:YeiH family protein [Neisseria weixii]RPD89055.1 YeiH family putative sulfate export transporter [Neisseria weixii]RPD89302.1 YeiH family putative sulfate export transporter [Neisseria weixii]